MVAIDFGTWRWGRIGGAPGTFHQPAHGFGMKRAPKAAELSLSGPMTGEQKLGEGFLKPLRVTLEMRPNGRAERLIPPGNLGRRIVHQPSAVFSRPGRYPFR